MFIRHPLEALYIDVIVFRTGPDSCLIIIIYKDFIILCLLHFNDYCNFTCNYVLTYKILHLVHILLILLWNCISCTP
jgi:hypothetical protein